MAENNSPLKLSRAFHPYGRVKSPLKQSAQQTVPPALTSSRRPLGPLTSGKPLRGTGFIPVQRSFTIWGDTDSNSNSMEFADEVGKDHVENTPALALTAEDLHRSKSDPENFVQEGIEQVENIELDKSCAGGILTERKHAIYDSPEYIPDIYKYYLDYEYRVPIKPQYMSRQEDITHNMRSILVDWLVEVGQEYGFEEGTIFMAVSFVDRFLGRMGVVRNKLQLVGTTAMYIAAKLQEVEPPGITDVVHITDETYSKEQILIMEGIMLRTIQFDLLVPTACDFLRALASLLSLDTHLTSLALYLAELSMIDGERFLRYKPSVIATAAIALSRYTLEDTFWDTQIEHFSELTYPEVRPASGDLLVAFYDASSSSDLTAVYEKYKSVRYNCVSYSILRATLPAP